LTPGGRLNSEELASAGGAIDKGAFVGAATITVVEPSTTTTLYNKHTLGPQTYNKNLTNSTVVTQ